MQRLRSFVLKHPALGAAILLTAMLLRFAVPAGFMPMVDRGRVTLAICSGYAPAPKPAAHHMAGMTHDAHHDDGADRTQNPCAFADLALPVIGGADPVQLAAALLFILALALLLRTALPARRAVRLRPPLRGPPIPA